LNEEAGVHRGCRGAVQREPPGNWRAAISHGSVIKRRMQKGAKRTTMSNDEFNHLMNRKSSEIRAPRTSPATTDAWRAIMDRPHDDHERRWFIDNWFQTTERLLEAGDEPHYQTQHRRRHHPAIRRSMLPAS
jgi:uncharacterized protein YcbX